jgi:hypothetical protein
MGIGTLLKKVLAVPPNQRSYSWRKEMVLDFLRDIHQAISDDDPNYFIGTIVLVETPSGVPEIADGQQRLATAAILLARIRDLMRSLGKETGANALDQEFIRKYDDETESFIQRLKLNDADNTFFASSILASPSDPDYEPLPAERRSNKRLLQASEAIAAYLQNMIQLDQPTTRAQTLVRWRKFIENSAFVILVEAEDEVGAYRIFETMNDRGLRASQADILKNYLFSKAGSRLKEAQAMWGEMSAAIESLVVDEEDQEGGALLTYLRHFWITTHGPTKSSELAAQIKSEIGGQSKAIQFLSNATGAVQDYIALGSSKHPKWARYSASVRRNVDTIAEHLQVRQIKPLLFAVAMRFTPAEAEKAFRLFVSWSVRFLIYGGRGGMLDEQYARRAKEVGTKQITKASELRQEMKKYVPTDAEFEDAFANARVSRQRLARYYLRAIEKTKVGDDQPEYIANEDIQDISLEHILPLKPGGDWDVEDELAEASQKMLGNMVLLKANQNRDLGNRPFKEKKTTYAESGYLSTKEVSAYRDWSLDEIKDRQSKMAKLAVKTWGLTFADSD